MSAPLGTQLWTGLLQDAMGILLTQPWESHWGQLARQDQLLASQSGSGAAEPCLGLTCWTWVSVCTGVRDSIHWWGLLCGAGQRGVYKLKACEHTLCSHLPDSHVFSESSGVTPLTVVRAPGTIRCSVSWCSLRGVSSTCKPHNCLCGFRWPREKSDSCGATTPFWALPLGLKGTLVLSPSPSLAPVLSEGHFAPVWH